jgi:cytoskeletal protein CcmA (bactofilin family)
MTFWTRQAEPSHEKEEIPMAMMKRDELPAATSGQPAGDLLLGAGAEFEGKLTFAGTVRIDAKFKGSIVTNDVLVVGEHARIDADITCGTVIVYGEVNGNISAKIAIELRHPARVRGDIETRSLLVEKGVLFQGHSKMIEPEPGSPVKMVGADPPGRRAEGERPDAGTPADGSSSRPAGPLESGGAGKRAPAASSATGRARSPS